MTIIAMTLATAPIALPTALVSRPTEPSSWLPRLVGWPLGIRPSEAAKSISRSNCAVTTSAQRLELGGDGRSGEPDDPADEAEAEEDGRAAAASRAGSAGAGRAAARRRRGTPRRSRRRRSAAAAGRGRSRRRWRAPCRTTPRPCASRGGRAGRGTPPDRAARHAARWSAAAAAISCSGATFRRGPSGSASNQVSGFHHIGRCRRARR